MKLKQRIKTWIAQQIDRINTVCWGDLSGWTIDRKPFWSILPWHEESPYGLWCDRKSGAYCGKCYMTGKLEVPEDLKEHVEAMKQRGIFSKGFNNQFLKFN